MSDRLCIYRDADEEEGPWDPNEALTHAKFSHIDMHGLQAGAAMQLIVESNMSVR